LELDRKNLNLLKQKTQGSVPLNTLTVPELIQTLPSLQPQGSSRRSMSEAVLGISDILVRIWILGVPLTNGYGFDKKRTDPTDPDADVEYW
jgi:hypothetical protein